MCVDLRRLNQAVKRKLYQMPTIKYTWKHSWKCSLLKIRCQPRVPTSSLRPRKLQVNFIHNSLWKVYVQAFAIGDCLNTQVLPEADDASLEGFARYIKCHMHDILVIGCNQADHNERLRALLDRLLQLTLNLDKCLFSVTKLDYLG